MIAIWSTRKISASSSQALALMGGVVLGLDLDNPAAGRSKIEQSAVIRLQPMTGTPKP
jgi:hypothetical protein